jgi:choice-of-anchor B domain-containing protein
MKTFAAVLLSLMVSFSGISQNWNMSQCFRYDDPNLPFRGPVAYNDVWGYVCPAGEEVGIIGTVDSIFFFEISGSCSGSLRKIFSFKGGASSIWRDIKTYRNYAYTTADEGTEGLLVFDLEDAPDSIAFMGRDDSTFHRAHNLFVDTATGHLYIAGASLNNVGISLIMYDLNPDPSHPQLIKKISLPGGYVHDVHVRNDTAFASHGYYGLGIYAIHPNGNFTEISSITNYPQKGYNHSSWVTRDGKNIVFADETHNMGLKIYELNDISKPKLASIFRSALLAPGDSASIVHNPFIKDDYIYLAYYHDGVQIFNMPDPKNPYKVAYFDTEPNNTDYSGFQGCWGVYPYLPSGRIIATDIANGFFVINVDILLALNDIKLEANSEKDGIMLHWDILADQSSTTSGIELQKSTDGKTWEGMYALSEHEMSASWMDHTPIEGQNYYRMSWLENAVQKSTDPVSTLWFKEETQGLIYLIGDEIYAQQTQATGIDQLKIFSLDGRLLESIHQPTFPVKINNAHPGNILLLEIKKTNGESVFTKGFYK